VARVLALDVGTSSVRAQRTEGEIARREYPGENDPDRIVELTREAIDKAGGLRGVDAAGSSCFGHSLLPLDADGRPLTPVLGWRDTRSANAADWLSTQVDPASVHARTGCHVHTSYWPAKLAWLAREQRHVFRAARRFVSFSDYLYARILGREIAMSLSMASSTGLLDLHAGSWDAELLEVLDLDPARLPEMSDEPADDWFPAVFDGACSNIGTGCVTRSRATLAVGTSAAFRTLYETERPQPRAGLFLYRLDERRVVEGGSLSDGGSLYHWLDETLRDADGRLADRAPDSHGLTFLTLLGGERSPGWRRHARGAILGLTFDTTPLDIRQAALEGVAFRFAEIVDLMPEVDEIVAAGGVLSKNRDWLQIIADILQRPIHLSGVDEASLRGAAALTLERLGEAAGGSDGSTRPLPELRPGADSAAPHGGRARLARAAVLTTSLDPRR
jgi:gluconokinase